MSELLKKESLINEPVPLHSRQDGCGLTIEGIKRASLKLADGEVLRLGIMGGTFDPIHLGHLNCAERTLDALGLFAVLFLPAGDPAFKQGADIAPGLWRFEMCKAATDSNSRFFVSDMEINREGITYTIDTLRELSDMLPQNVELVFIVGADALLSLNKWRDIEALGKLASFACVSRPGYAVEGCVVDELADAGVRVEVINAPMLDVSSTDVRMLCSESRSIRYLCPDAVCEMIYESGLYGFDKRRFKERNF